jgi:hypothetical protein
MVPIPENWKKVLDFLVEAPVALQSAEDIARALLWNVEETKDLLCDMDIAGWISVWDTEPRLLITLSTLAAHRYQVVLVELGPDEVPRWSLPGQPDPVPPRAKNVSSCELHATQDQAPDPNPGPDLVLERAEELAERAARYREFLAATCLVKDLPPPCHFLGQSLTPWPGPPQSNLPQRCPVCADRPLQPHVYCLYCNRWGLDEVLQKLIAQSENPGRGLAPSSQAATLNQSASASPESSPDAPAPDASPQRAAMPFKHNRARRKAMRKAWRTVRSAKA